MVNISVNGSNPRKVKASVLACSSGLGNVLSVSHTNNALDSSDDSVMNALTEFVFANGSVVVENALTSGYEGAGSNCLFELLVAFGFDVDVAKKKVYNENAFKIVELKNVDVVAKQGGGMSFASKKSLSEQ